MNTKRKNPYQTLRETFTIATIVREMIDEGVDPELAQKWADRLAALGVPNQLAAEYQRWIDFFHAGEGDFNDFMRKEFPDD